MWSGCFFGTRCALSAGWLPPAACRQQVRLLATAAADWAAAAQQLTELATIRGLKPALAFLESIAPGFRTEQLYKAGIDACIANLARRDALRLQNEMETSHLKLGAQKVLISLAHTSKHVPGSCLVDCITHYDIM